jgi:hypothetical protein
MGPTSNLVASGSEKDFFFEKKKQKTFINFSFAVSTKIQKFFGSFFQKRTLFFATTPGAGAPGVAILRRDRP